MSQYTSSGPMTGNSVARDVARACSRCCMMVVDAIVGMVGPVLSSLATFLIFFVVYAYFTEVLPVLILQHGHSTAQLFTGFGLFLLTNLLWNYFCTMFVGPGHVPEVLPEDIRNLLVHDPEVEEGRPHRFCRKCNRVKPMRAHHCSICKKCVLKMDHHCPWVNNCVGHYNHKYFLGFLAYMCSGSGFVLFVSFETTLQALSGRNSSAVFLFATVMCFSAFVATGLFFLWNTYLVLSNQTTIEFYGNKFSNEGRRRGNPYDMGWRKNLADVFGNDCSLWSFFVPNRRKPASDGLMYQMKTIPNPPFPRSGGRTDASIAL